MPGSHGGKVGRVIEEYELDGLGGELEQRWTAEGEERTSLRDLATDFNERVLEAAMTRHGRQPAPEAVETTYRLLTDDDANPSSRTRTERDLERDGIDVESIKRDFVSHQAIHTYLTEHREATAPESDTDAIASAESAIDRLQSRTAAVTRTTVDRLMGTDDFAESDVEVLVSVEVFCNDCGRSHTVGEYIDAGGCDCEGSG
jgi:hypothetical protein